MDAAVVNAGALRLNQDLPAEAVFRRRHLEELIQYDDDLLLIDLSGADLTAALRHSASCVGGGPWLQTHGITFAFDPNDRTIDRIQIGGEPIRPSSTYRVALPSFIAGGGDRYTWFANAPRVARHPVSLKAVLLEAMPGPGAPLGAPPVGAIELADLDLPAPEPCPVD